MYDSGILLFLCQRGVVWQLLYEVGKLKMTYRIVTPIFKDGDYVGLVEFGIEPKAFMSVVDDIVVVYCVIITVVEMNAMTAIV